MYLSRFLLFVGIPIPGTGAWTGTLAASILDIDFKKTVLSVTLGVAACRCNYDDCKRRWSKYF